VAFVRTSAYRQVGARRLRDLQAFGQHGLRVHVLPMLWDGGSGSAAAASGGLAEDKSAGSTRLLGAPYASAAGGGGRGAGGLGLATQTSGGRCIPAC